MGKFKHFNAYYAIKMWQFIHKLSSPKYSYTFIGKIIPWFAMITILLFAFGLIDGLWFAPPDYQQGDGFRIMYVHVPSAILSLSIYVFMAACGFIALVWRIKIMYCLIRASTTIGASFAFLALVTGSIWGKPMWGTWWVWDARLTSELILLFLYLGVIALQNAITDREKAGRATSILLLIGVIDIPIIHYSVNWWHTLHQGASLQLFSKPTIAPLMLYPLIIMIFAFGFYFLTLLCLRTRNEILLQEQQSRWVKQI